MSSYTELHENQTHGLDADTTSLTDAVDAISFFNFVNHAYKGVRNILNSWHTRELHTELQICLWFTSIPNFKRLTWIIYYLRLLNWKLHIIRSTKIYIYFFFFFLRSVSIPHINIPYKVTMPLHKFTRLPCIGYCYLPSYRPYEVPVTTNSITS